MKFTKQFEQADAGCYETKGFNSLLLDD